MLFSCLRGACDLSFPLDCFSSLLPATLSLGGKWTSGVYRGLVLLPLLPTCPGERLPAAGGSRREQRLPGGAVPGHVCPPWASGTARGAPSVPAALHQGGLSWACTPCLRLAPLISPVSFGFLLLPGLFFFFLLRLFLHFLIYFFIFCGSLRGLAHLLKLLRARS